MRRNRASCVRQTPELGNALRSASVSEEHNLHEEVHSAWDELSAFWDERIEAGTTWQRHLIQPSVERLLQLGPGERVLEIACGNGEFARRMSELGGQVVAVDFSEGMLERARAHGGNVDYRHTDAMAEGALLLSASRDRSTQSSPTWQSWTWSPSSRW
jgi:ubiquinone/menaquinone biosynthesis C-methylase UbiE